MNIKLDENIPAKLTDYIAEMEHDVDSVLKEKLKGHQDSEVWEAAQRVQRFFITQDMDFSDIRKFTPGTHAGILLVRLQSPGRTALLKKLLHTFRFEDVESWKECFVVLTDNKIRVHRPKNQK